MVAIQSVVYFDHSDNWRDAITYPSRPFDAKLVLPGYQVNVGKKGLPARPEKARKGKYNTHVNYGHHNSNNGLDKRPSFDRHGVTINPDIRTMFTMDGVAS